MSCNYTAGNLVRCPAILIDSHLSLSDAAPTFAVEMRLIS